MEVTTFSLSQGFIMKGSESLAYTRKITNAGYCMISHCDPGQFSERFYCTVGFVWEAPWGCTPVQTLAWTQKTQHEGWPPTAPMHWGVDRDWAGRCNSPPLSWCKAGLSFQTEHKGLDSVQLFSDTWEFNLLIESYPHPPHKNVTSHPPTPLQHFDYHVLEFLDPKHPSMDLVYKQMNASCSGGSNMSFGVPGKGAVAKWCPTLCDPVDYSSPGSPVHGIL